MKRPYIICHILSSLDAKINGPFMGTDAARQLGAEYGKIRSELHADAWLYGTATTKEFTGFWKPELENTGEVPKGDFVADAGAGFYYVSVDTEGEIGWESGTWKAAGRPDAHVIEVLTETTPLEYKVYLRKKGVSYIICGKEKMDCRIAVEKLRQYFDIETMLICGGGMVNWSFLQAGVIDELSLLLAPVTDGGAGKASLFTQMPSLTDGKPVAFELKKVELLGKGGLHLNYRTQAQKEL